MQINKDFSWHTWTFVISTAVFCSHLWALLSSVQQWPKKKWGTGKIIVTTRINTWTITNVKTFPLKVHIWRCAAGWTVNPLLSASVPPVKSGGPQGAGGFSDPVLQVSVPFFQPPFPACCSEDLYGLHYQKVWRPDAFNSPCSWVLSLPPNCCSPLGSSVSFTACAAPQVAVPMFLLPVFMRRSNASAFLRPSAVLPSAREDAEIRIISKWSLVQNKINWHCRGLYQRALLQTMGGLVWQAGGVWKR